MTKTCSQCGQSKPLLAFKEAGRKATCKVCDATRAKEYRKENKEAVNERKRWKYQADPEAREKKNAMTRAWRDRMREEGKYDDIALRHRCNRYNITVERYYEMLAEQGGKCPGCGAITDFQIDHDHNCCPEDSRSCGECVRGLLCGSCNTLAGRIETEPARHVAILVYLDSARERNVLKA